MPHNNESGYWWQGENARLASLAAMAFAGARHFPRQSQPLHHLRSAPTRLAPRAEPLQRLHAGGLRHQQSRLYRRVSQCAGGICNGITAGFDDENDVAFIPEEYKDRLDQNWRWGEQWIPHAAWFALAISWQSALSDRNEQGGHHD